MIFFKMAKGAETFIIRNEWLFTVFNYRPREWGRMETAPSINLPTKRRWVSRFTAQLLYFRQKKTPCIYWIRELVEPQNLSSGYKELVEPQNLSSGYKEQTNVCPW